MIEFRFKCEFQLWVFYWNQKSNHCTGNNWIKHCWFISGSITCNYKSFTELAIKIIDQSGSLFAVSSSQQVDAHLNINNEIQVNTLKKFKKWQFTLCQLPEKFKFMMAHVFFVLSLMTGFNQLEKIILDVIHLNIMILIW